METQSYQHFITILTDFVNKLQQDPFQINKIVHQDEHTAIISIILTYLPPNATLLVDLQSNSTITCIHKYITFEKPKKDYELSNDHIWITTDKKIYIIKPKQKNKKLFDKIFSQKSNENKENYEIELVKNPSRQADPWTEPNLDKIVDIKALCITPRYRIVVIADDGYTHDNMWLYCSGHFHWTGNKRPGTFGGRSTMNAHTMYDKYHYITTEILAVMRAMSVDSTSNLWHADDVCMKVYECLNDNANMFKEIIRIDMKDTNRKNHHSLGKNLKEIHDMFDVKKHILFVYGASAWAIYVPKEIYLNCAKRNKQIVFVHCDENNECVNVDSIKDIYRITNEYVIYCKWGVKELKKWNVEICDFIPKCLFNDYYDCVLKDFLYERLLVSKDCQLFELSISW